ncbi:MAG: protein-glutamate O-methyltransferase CheR [Pseudomonadota bacterium]
MNIGTSELHHLCKDIHTRYGYDFSHYAVPSFSRRVHKVLNLNNLQSVDELHARVMGNPQFFYAVLNSLTVTVTDFYRDPAVWQRIRTDLVPHLRKYKSLTFWSAACSSGQEAYSLAILLHESGLLNRSTIYATDINYRALEHAKKGEYSANTIRAGQDNYASSQGPFEFAKYFNQYGHDYTILPELRRRVIFKNQNLARESSLGKMNLVFCRNAMIYFDKMLNNTVLTLLDESLVKDGFLIIGTKESLSQTPISDNYTTLHCAERIFKKKPLA